MTDIDINAKTDRELLIMAISKLNSMCDTVQKHETLFYNNGFGIIFQVKALWLLAGGGWVIAAGILIRTYGN